MSKLIVPGKKCHYQFIYIIFMYVAQGQDELKHHKMIQCILTTAKKSSNDLLVESAKPRARIHMIEPEIPMAPKLRI